MLQFVEDYSLQIGERVECYYNSKKKMVSIRSIDSRNENQSKIVAYTEYLHLAEVTFSFSTTNNRKVIRGIFSGLLPIVPKVDMQVLHDGSRYLTINNDEIIGAKYAVCFKGMILAEQPVLSNQLQLKSV